MPTPPPPMPGRTGRVLLTALVIPWFTVTAAAAADLRTGEQVYRQDCASCHGEAGQGTPKEYPHPLTGDRSVAQLAGVIEATMPADDPGSCEAEDAAKVAAYVHDAFYSKAARSRTEPGPRVELCRLTVRQYRNALADLVGSFRPAGKVDDQRGLRGEYYKSRRKRPNDRVIDRRDPAVAFDYGASSPDPGTLDPREFAVRWTGSVLAAETGEYEFILKTANTGKLWVNDEARPLVDASVRSGTSGEYRGTIRLLGGHAYPVRLEYAKVDGKKVKEPTASVALLWRPPGGVDGVIPERHLLPNKGPAEFVPETPFPPDDRSVGYERGASVSRAWDQATTDGALEAADYVAAHLQELADLRDDAKPEDRGPRLREFARRFAERAFRRPLDGPLRAVVDRQFDRAGGDPELAVKRVVLLTLKSPRFLYHDLGGPASGSGMDPYSAASRISFGLWDSLPDPVLLEAAANGRLGTRAEVAAQAARMADDPRAKAKLRAFFFRWLRVDQAPDLAKDPDRYPGFDPAVAADLRASLDLFLEDVVGGSGDFRQLLLADYTYLNGRLAKFYGGGGGLDLAADAPFRKVALDPTERAGVLTHPYLLAALSYTGASSPIHRGVFLTRGVLGRSLKPPPVAVAPLAADGHEGLSTRERVGLQTRPESCQTCHAVINPLGFALERFDAAGRLRDRDGDRPVDATGSYQVRSGGTSTFNGARELAAFLAESDEARDAFVERLWHELVKQPARAYGASTLPDLRRSFDAQGCDVRKLAVEIIAASALTGLGRPVSTPAGPAGETAIAGGIMSPLPDIKDSEIWTPSPQPGGGRPEAPDPDPDPDSDPDPTDPSHPHTQPEV